MAKKKSKTKKKLKSANHSRKSKLSRKEYEAKLFKLHAELVKLQHWVKEKGHKIVVIFEGRDAAGKGGVIKAITERVSPRVFRVVALPAPSDREKTQLYMQRYIAHLPSGGEVVLFDRSWYNRAGVEPVMGFCTPEEYETFLTNAPGFENWIVEQGIILVKYFFAVSQQEQKRRFLRRINDPLRQWKLSPTDIASLDRWDDYAQATLRNLRRMWKRPVLLETRREGKRILYRNDGAETGVELDRSKVGLLGLTEAADLLVGEAEVVVRHRRSGILLGVPLATLEFLPVTRHRRILPPRRSGVAAPDTRRVAIRRSILNFLMISASLIPWSCNLASLPRPRECPV